jgi:hypothetical protein
MHGHATDRAGVIYDNQENHMIRHTVAFKLKHPPGSAPEHDFLQAAETLASIPVVRNFERLHQIGTKNPYSFGFSMEFASQADYAAYNAHPVHVRFVESRWKPEVSEFLELDYTPLATD